MKRTQTEINRQIEGLKKEKSSRPEYNYFCDNNWAVIDAKISILEGGDVEQFKDDEIDEYDEISVVEQAAYEAQDWLNSTSAGDLFTE